jgi:hypothetical protein
VYIPVWSREIPDLWEDKNSWAYFNVALAQLHGVDLSYSISPNYPIRISSFLGDLFGENDPYATVTGMAPKKEKK